MASLSSLSFVEPTGNEHSPGSGLSQEPIGHSNRFSTLSQDSNTNFQSESGSHGLSGQDSYCGPRNTMGSAYTLGDTGYARSLSGDDGSSILSTSPHSGAAIGSVNLDILSVQKARQVELRGQRPLNVNKPTGEGRFDNHLVPGSVINLRSPLDQLGDRAATAVEVAQPGQNPIYYVTNAEPYQYQYPNQCARNIEVNRMLSYTPYYKTPSDWFNHTDSSAYNYSGRPCDAAIRSQSPDSYKNPSVDENTEHGSNVSENSSGAQAGKHRSSRRRRFNANRVISDAEAGPDGPVANESCDGLPSGPTPALNDGRNLSHVQLTPSQQRAVEDLKSYFDSEITVSGTIPEFSVKLSDCRPKLDLNESVNGWENDTSTFFSNLASKLTDVIRSVYSWMLGSKQSASTLSPELKQPDGLDQSSDHLSLPTPSVTTTNRAVVNAAKGKPRNKRPRKTSRRKQRTAATARCSTALRPAPGMCGMKLRKPERDRGKKYAAPLMSTQRQGLEAEQQMMILTKKEHDSRNRQARA